MRILIFNWQDIRNPLAGGAEVHLHEIFSRIVSRGHEVTLFCSWFPGAATEEFMGGIRVIREGGRHLFNFRVVLRYLDRFHREGYDIIIDDMNKIPFFTPLYVKEPLAVIVHHLFGKSIYREASLPVALYVNFAERAGVSIFRETKVPMMVVSDSTRSELLEKSFSPERIEIVHNCVDHALHRPDPSHRSPHPLIAYFGRLKKYKSVDHLLLAFARIREKIPGSTLVIIGEGDHRPTLEKLSHSLGLDGAIRFTGFVTPQEKIELLQQAWFLVNTSSKEGWGLTVIEANACGTPVIAANVPGLRDAVRDRETGMLYEYGNISGLADMILSLAKDQDFRDRLSKGAYDWSLKFDWDEVAGHTVKLLEQYIADHRRARA